MSSSNTSSSHPPTTELQQHSRLSLKMSYCLWSSNIDRTIVPAVNACSAFIMVTPYIQSVPCRCIEYECGALKYNYLPTGRTYREWHSKRWNSFQIVNHKTLSWVYIHRLIIWTTNMELASCNIWHTSCTAISKTHTYNSTKLR